MSSRLDPDELPPTLATLFRREHDDRVVAGINDDDCAVIRFGNQLLVVTTDFLNARPISLQLGLATFQELGRLLILANLSDLCGSGARPCALLIAVTMERTDKTEDFLNFMEGVRSEADRWAVPVVGGDTKLGDCRSFAAVAIGSAVTERNLFLKNGARAGQLLWCSGSIGSCNAAVIGIKSGKLSGGRLQWAKEAILSPTLPLAKSRGASESMLGSGGTDISDGLGADLHSLCDASNVGVRLLAEKIPIDSHVTPIAEDAGIEPWQFAFGTGGDCQFLITSERSSARKLEALGFVEIGEITSDHSKELVVSGVAQALPSGGHRDARGLSFSEEIMRLITGAST